VLIPRSALAIHGYTSRSPITPKPVSRNHRMKAKLLPPFFHLSTTTFRVPRFLHQKNNNKKKSQYPSNITNECTQEKEL
jgi:hypothetical protein